MSAAHSLESVVTHLSPNRANLTLTVNMNGDLSSNSVTPCGSNVVSPSVSNMENNNRAIAADEVFAFGLQVKPYLPNGFDQSPTESIPSSIFQLSSAWTSKNVTPISSTANGSPAASPSSSPCPSASVSAASSSAPSNGGSALTVHPHPRPVKVTSAISSASSTASTRSSSIDSLDFVSYTAENDADESNTANAAAAMAAAENDAVIGSKTAPETHGTKHANSQGNGNANGSGRHGGRRGQHGGQRSNTHSRGNSGQGQIQHQHQSERNAAFHSHKSASLSSSSSGPHSLFNGSETSPPPSNPFLPSLSPNVTSNPYLNLSATPTTNAHYLQSYPAAPANAAVSGQRTPNMANNSSSGVCKFFLNGQCTKGSECGYAHVATHCSSSMSLATPSTNTASVLNQIQSHAQQSRRNAPNRGASVVAPTGVAVAAVNVNSMSNVAHLGRQTSGSGAQNNALQIGRRFGSKQKRSSQSPNGSAASTPTNANSKTINVALIANDSPSGANELTSSSSSSSVGSSASSITSIDSAGSIPALSSSLCATLSSTSSGPASSSLPADLLTKLGSNPSFSDVHGHIAALAKDQYGCRLLQRLLDDKSAAPDKKAKFVCQVYEETVDHIQHLMIDPFGNYLCQKLIEYSSEQQRLSILQKVQKDLLNISLNMHGTRAVQKLVETVRLPAEIALVIAALSGHVVQLIHDLNGNHVIQRALHHFHSCDNQFIYDSIAKQCVAVATHKHGCCCMQRAIDYANQQQKKQLVQEIVAHALELVQDAFGNYCVQYILDLGEHSISQNVTTQLLGSIPPLSLQKFSSNVIEKLLDLANEKLRGKLLDELCNAQQLPRLLQDPFGNYVVQRALTVSKKTPQQYDKLMNAIKPHLTALKNTAFGKRIQSKLLKKFPDFHQSELTHSQQQQQQQQQQLHTQNPQLQNAAALGAHAAHAQQLAAMGLVNHGALFNSVQLANSNVNPLGLGMPMPMNNGLLANPALINAAAVAAASGTAGFSSHTHAQGHVHANGSMHPPSEFNGSELPVLQPSGLNPFLAAAMNSALLNPAHPLASHYAAVGLPTTAFPLNPLTVTLPNAAHAQSHQAQAHAHAAHAAAAAAGPQLQAAINALSLHTHAHPNALHMHTPESAAAAAAAAFLHLQAQAHAAQAQLLQQSPSHAQLSMPFGLPHAHIHGHAPHQVTDALSSGAVANNASALLAVNSPNAAHQQKSAS